MARTIASGVPGLEVAHKLNGAFGSIVMNVRTARPSRVQLTDIKGLYSLPDADDAREAHIGRRGEAIYPSARRGKTIVYIGKLQSRTQQGLRTLTAEFKKATCANRSAEMKVQLQDPEVPWFFNARVIDCEIDEEQTNGPTSVWPWTRTFQLSLRLSDARVYVDNGGAAYPSNAAGSTVNVTNEGTTDTDPFFIVQCVEGTACVIKNNTLGTKLRLAGMPSGEIGVNFLTREIVREGADASKYLDEESSDWWDEDQIGIAPGISALQVTGAEWGVTFLHAAE